MERSFKRRAVLFTKSYAQQQRNSNGEKATESSGKRLFQSPLICRAFASFQSEILPGPYKGKCIAVPQLATWNLLLRKLI